MRSRLRRKPNGKLSPTALVVRSTPAERSTYKKAKIDGEPTFPSRSTERLARFDVHGEERANGNALLGPQRHTHVVSGTEFVSGQDSARIQSMCLPEVRLASHEWQRTVLGIFGQV